MSKVLRLILLAIITLSIISPNPALSKNPGKPAAVDDPGCQASVSEAAAFFAQGFNLQAADLLRKWSKRCPGNCQLHLLLSTVLLRLGAAPQEVLSEAAQAVTADDKSVAAHLQYGLVLMNQDKAWQARRELEKVVALDPGNYEAWSSLANVYRQLHEDGQAQAAAQQAAALEPGTRSVQKRVSDNIEHGKPQSDPQELQKLIDGEEPSP